MKICPMGTELFDVHGRTDTTKLIVAFRNSANAPKDVSISSDQNISSPSPPPQKGEADVKRRVREHEKVKLPFLYVCI